MRRNNSKDGTTIKQNRATRHVDHIKQRYFKPSVKLDNPDESRYTGIRRWDSFILNECNASLPLSTISPSSWSCSEHSHSMDLSGRLSNSLNKLLKGKGRILCHLVDRLCCLNTSLNCLSERYDNGLNWFFERYWHYIVFGCFTHNWVYSILFIMKLI